MISNGPKALLYYVPWTTCNILQALQVSVSYTAVANEAVTTDSHKRETYIVFWARYLK